jgi:hypothetical protein
MQSAICLQILFLVRDLESGNVKLLYKVSLGLVDLNT